MNEVDGAREAQVGDVSCRGGRCFGQSRGQYMSGPGRAIYETEWEYLSFTRA